MTSAEPAFLDPGGPAVIVAILLCVDARGALGACGINNLVS